MKKYVLYLFAISFTIFLSAGINVKGVILNLKNNSQKVDIYIYEGTSEKNIGSSTINTDGSFAFTSTLDYSGFLFIKINKVTIPLVNDDSPIFFEYDFELNHFISLKSDVNKLYQSETFNSSKEEISSNLKKMLSVYNSIDNKTFSDKLKIELERVNGLKSNQEYEKYPFLKYYFNLNNKFKDVGESPSKADSKFFEFALKNDGSYLENSGLLKNVLVSYYSGELAEVKDRNKMEAKLDSLTGNLLNNVTCESSRGQNILEISLQLFKTSKIESLYKKYLEKAEKLTCGIKNENLKNLLNSSSIKIGAKVPDYKFEQALNGKATLFEFKAKNKIIVFYASWCGHCEREMPQIIELFKNKKDKGVEFILVSLDEKQADYKNFIKDFPKWNNYVEFEGFNSDISKAFAIEGTPTIFLLDENNVIKVISHNLEEIKKLLP